MGSNPTIKPWRNNGRRVVILFMGVLLLLLSGFRTLPESTPGKPLLPALMPLQLQQPLPFNLPGTDLRRDDSLSFSMPFNKMGGLILLKAKVDGVEGNFILDTGAPHLVLNMVYFRHYNIEVVPQEQQSSVSGVAQNIHRTRLKNFTLGDMSYYQQDADLTDLGHIENSKGVKILGLIGLDLLLQTEMIIDYEHGMIHFHRIGRKEGTSYQSSRLAADPLSQMLPIEIKQQQILASGEMAGKKLKFVFDSGAETHILDSRLPEKLIAKVAIMGRMTVKGTGNKTFEALRGRVSGMRLGQEDLGELQVLIANLEHTCFAQNMGVHGVLGLDFMKLRKIGFNFVTRKMYLWK